MERAKVACLLVLLFASLIAATATNRYWSGNATSTSIMTKASSVTNISSYNTWYHNGTLCLWNATEANWSCVVGGWNVSGGGGGGGSGEVYNGTFNETDNTWIYNSTPFNISLNITAVNDSLYVQWSNASAASGGVNSSIQFNYNNGFYGASNFTIDFANNYLNVFNRAGLLFWNGTNYAGFRAGENASNTTWNLPPSDGAVSQVLQTDGEGNLSWATVYGTGVLTWVNPVLDKDLTTPPALNATGDRYIVGWTTSGWYDGAWTYRSEIDIDHLQVQGDWSGEIYGLNLVDDAHDVFKYSNSGNDFIITESDGVTPIEAFCLERYSIDPSGATENITTIWLRLDNVNDTTDKKLFLYYGNPSASSASDCETTFGSDRGLFYDLTTSGVDYTINGRDADVLVGVTDNKYSYPAGWASDFPQSTTGYFNLKDIAYWEQQWYKRIHMIVFTPNENNERQTVFAEGGGTNGMQLYIDTDASLHAFWWSRSNSMTDVDVVWDNAINVGETYYAVLAFDGNTGLWGQADLWVNGTPESTGIGNPDKAYINAHSGDGAVGSTGKNTKLFHDGAKTTTFFNGTIDYFATADDPDDDIFGANPDDFAFNWFSALSNATGFWSVGAATVPAGGASGAWAGYEQNITEWNGTGWDFYDPMAGWATYVVDEQSYYSFDGTNWGLMSGQISHQALTQLQGGYDTGDIATSEYYHLNESNYTVATREATQTQSGIMPSGKLDYWDLAYDYRLEAIDTDYSSVVPVDARFGVVGGANIWSNASNNYQNVTVALDNDISLESGTFEDGGGQPPITAIENSTVPTVSTEIAQFVHKTNLVLAAGFGGYLGFYVEGAATPKTEVARFLYELTSANNASVKISNFRAGTLEDHLGIEPEGVTHFYNQSRARVYLDNPQTIMCGIPNLILFDATNYDEQSEMGGAGVETFTATYSGYYDVKCGYWLEDMMFPRDIVWIDIYLNGALYTQQVYESTSEMMFVSLDVSDTLPLTAGDTVECYAECQGMMGMFRLLTGSPYTYMAIHKLS